MGDHGNQTVMLGEAKEELPVQPASCLVANGPEVLLPAQRPAGAEQKQVKLNRLTRCPNQR